MATFVKTPGGKWKAIVRVRDVTLCRTAARKTDLLPWVESTERKIRMGQGVPAIESKVRCFAEAVERYEREVLPRLTTRTAATHRARLRWWVSKIGRTPLCNITVDTLERHCRTLLEQGPGDAAGRRAALNGGGVSPSTARGYMVAVGGLFTVMRKKWRWVDYNPVRDCSLPPTGEARERVLTGEEMGRLLAECRRSRSPYLGPVVELLLETGCRFGEVSRLQWRDVDLDKRTIRLPKRKTKSRRVRIVPLTEHAVAILRDLYQRRVVVDLTGADVVFPGKTDRTKPVGQLKTAWTAACRRAGIADFHIHDLRHVVATYLFQSGVGLDQIGRLLGHKSKSVTSLYAHLGLDELRRLLERKENGGTR